MKPSASVIAGLADMKKVSTFGDMRQICSELLLGMARGEVAADVGAAAAKLCEAITSSTNAEIRMHMVAAELRERGAKFSKVEPVGRTLIGTSAEESTP